MGQWISSREFAEKYNLNRDTIVKSTSRADKKGKNFCSIRFNILYFKYSEGIGGYAGKVLQIWDTPLSKKQVEALEKGYPVKYVLEEMGEVAQPNVMESNDSKTLDCKGINNEKTSQKSERKTLHTRGCNNANECASRATSSSDSTLYRNDLSNGGVVESERADKVMDCFGQSPRNDAMEKHTTTWHNLTSSQKAQAKQREKILIDYESAKASGIRVADFLTLKNSEDSTLKLTQGKLFDWQRKYKAQGLSALSDKRGIAKSGTTSLPQWVQEEAIKMWRAMG